MTRLTRSTLLRWIAPAAVAGLLLGGGAAIGAITGSAAPAPLPVRSAGQLLVDVQQAGLGAVSGTVVQSSDLGIPSLPGIGGSGTSSSLTSLISGTHTLRVWYDGADKARIALLGRLGETDVIKNGRDLWTWSSQDNSATHRTLSPKTSGALAGLASKLPESPQQAADSILKAVGPSTIVSADGSQKVAGRSAYQLTLRPRVQAGSLVSRVTIAIDAAKHLPLRVQVFAVGHSDPAFSVAFTAVDFSAPDPAQFVFNPPPGATVTQIKPGGSPLNPGQAKPGEHSTPKAGTGRHQAGSPADGLRMVGSGWTRVLIAPSASVADSAQFAGIIRALPQVSGSWGSGRLLAGTLFSAVITSTGRIAVGAVEPSVLYAALGAK